MNKQKQRSMIKNRLNELTIDQKEKSSIEICKRILLCSAIKDAKTILSYMPMKNEVDISEANSFLKKEGKVICYPKVISDDEIVAVNANKFEKGAFGIEEPIIEGNIIDVNCIDLVIVPCVGFDKNKNRLGHGRGYYDRYLSKTKSYKLCVGFSSQLLSEVCTDENDVKMDEIISEKHIIL